MMFSYGPLHMDLQVLANQQELSNNSTVQTQDVVCKTCQDQWMIGTNGKREKPMLAVQLDEDDDNCLLRIIISYSKT